MMLMLENAESLMTKFNWIQLIDAKLDTSEKFETTSEMNVEINNLESFESCAAELICASDLLESKSVKSENSETTLTSDLTIDKSESVESLQSKFNLLKMMKTENDTVISVISNLRIDSTLVNEYLLFAHFFSFFFIRMLYLLHSLVKYIYMFIYSCVLVYQDNWTFKIIYDRLEDSSHFQFFEKDEWHNALHLCHSSHFLLWTCNSLIVLCQRMSWNDSDLHESNAFYFQKLKNVYFILWVMISFVFTRLYYQE